MARADFTEVKKRRLDRSGYYFQYLARDEVIETISRNYINIINWFKHCAPPISFVKLASNLLQQYKRRKKILHSQRSRKFINFSRKREFPYIPQTVGKSIVTGQLSKRSSSPPLPPVSLSTKRRRTKRCNYRDPEANCFRKQFRSA